MAKFEPGKLYPNVSQSASAYLKKMLSSYPWWVLIRIFNIQQWLFVPYIWCVGRHSHFCSETKHKFKVKASYVVKIKESNVYPQGPSDHTRLLHASLAAGLVPHEAEETDTNLHHQPTQRVPGGAAKRSYRQRHQAQSAAAHLPELPPGAGSCGWNTVILAWKSHSWCEMAGCLKTCRRIHEGDVSQMGFEVKSLVIMSCKVTVCIFYLINCTICHLHRPLVWVPTCFFSATASFYRAHMNVP